MVRQSDGNDVFNLVELRNQIYFALNRIGLNDGYYLAIRQHSMYFNAFKCGNTTRYGIGTTIKASDNNSGNRHTHSSSVPVLNCSARLSLIHGCAMDGNLITAQPLLESVLSLETQIKLMEVNFMLYLFFSMSAGGTTVVQLSA
jgi:hypothetical protein